MHGVMLYQNINKTRGRECVQFGLCVLGLHWLLDYRLLRIGKNGLRILHGRADL
jgi:hypothetical protein